MEISNEHHLNKAVRGTGVMLFTADQLVAHAVGDYILQSHWMATGKTKQSFAAAIHAITYTLPFIFITQSPGALAVICGTHFVVDRFRLARFLVWFKNGPVTYGRIVYGNAGDDDADPGLIPRRKEWGYFWKPVTATGYADDVPAWLSVWLLIIADNIIHVVCNALALMAFA